MKREIACVLVAGTIAFFVVGGCDDTEAACKVDTDCATGNICRDGKCGSPSPDAGTPAPDASTPACTTDGLDCTSPTDCCSQSCTDGKCGTPITPPTPTCKNLYELCQADCCEGLTCTNGTCR